MRIFACNWKNKIVSYYRSQFRIKGSEGLKVTLHNIQSGEEEVIINYLEMSREVEDIIRAAYGDDERICCTACEGGGGGDSKFMLSVRNILYAESVDRVTFLYTADSVYKSSCSLQTLELMYSEKGFFRCSKSMIINIYRISELRSESGGRINATMENGEHVIISRSYAKAFRRVLKREE